MLGLGIYMNYKYDWDHAVPPVAPVASWFPVFCIFTFTITCTVGFLVVPWVMIGELYPQKVRGLVGGMTTCMAHTFVFIVVKTYPFLKSVLEMHGTFILYGCISFVGKIGGLSLFFLTHSFIYNFLSFTRNHILLLLFAGNQRKNSARDRRLLFRSNQIAADEKS